jgi:15-cis-phytoene synthase
MTSVNPSLHGQTNFYLPMLLLPAPRRLALEGLYRFCREADDIADEPGTVAGKSRRLKGLRLDLRRGFKAGRSAHPILGPYLAAALPLGVTLPPLETILDGCERDLGSVRFRTFRELQDYSLQVAGGPGLASMEIFGFHDGPHRAYARNLGLFLQLTNVMRDVKEDLALGRLYLPVEDWKRFGLKPGVLPVPGPAWDAFVRFQLDRANGFWQAARRDLDLRERGALSTAEAIAAVYRRIHRELHADPSLALAGRVRLSAFGKAAAVLGAWTRCLVCKGWGRP